MSVYREKKSNTWLVDVCYRDATGAKKRHRRQGLPTRAAAERLERAIERGIQLGHVEAVEAVVAPPPPPPSARFSGYAKRFFETYVEVRHRQSTQRATEQILRVHLVPHLKRSPERDRGLLTWRGPPRRRAERLAARERRSQPNTWS